MKGLFRYIKNARFTLSTTGPLTGQAMHGMLQLAGPFLFGMISLSKKAYSMKIRSAIFFLLLFSCTTRLTEMPIEYSEAEKFYRERVKKDASFLLGCEQIDVQSAERAYIIRDFGVNQIITDAKFIRDNQLTYSVPISYFVSGCNKRTKFILVKQNRKNVCWERSTDPAAYVDKNCVPIQDSSLASE